MCTHMQLKRVKHLETNTRSLFEPNWTQGTKSDVNLDDKSRDTSGLSERMAGTTGLEPAASAVTEALARN